MRAPFFSHVPWQWAIRQGQARRERRALARSACRYWRPGHMTRSLRPWRPLVSRRGRACGQSPRCAQARNHRSLSFRLPTLPPRARCREPWGDRACRSTGVCCREVSHRHRCVEVFWDLNPPLQQSEADGAFCFHVAQCYSDAPTESCRFVLIRVSCRSHSP
jgi:hypothetical protein